MCKSSPSISSVTDHTQASLQAIELVEVRQRARQGRFTAGSRREQLVQNMVSSFRDGLMLSEGDAI